MKSMRPPSVAIFFMTYFHRARGHGPLDAPLDPLLQQQSTLHWTRIMLNMMHMHGTHTTLPNHLQAVMQFLLTPQNLSAAASNSKTSQLLTSFFSFDPYLQPATQSKVPLESPATLLKNLSDIAWLAPQICH